MIVTQGARDAAQAPIGLSTTSKLSFGAIYTRLRALQASLGRLGSKNITSLSTARLLKSPFVVQILNLAHIYHHYKRHRDNFYPSPFGQSADEHTPS